MKQFLTLVLTICALWWSSAASAQILNQPASWPNPAWTFGGNFNAAGVVNDPTVDATFSYDDDAAGSGSVDSCSVFSPVIDLTAASTGGETWLTIEYDYDYNLGVIFDLEYFDADASAWVLIENIPDNSSAISGWCAGIAAPTVTSPIIDISGWTATQLSGFQYRFYYHPTNFGWGVCVSSPTITSATPPSCIDPAAQAASVSSATTVDLSWTSADANFDIYVGIAPLTAPTAATTPTVDDHGSTTYSYTTSIGLSEEYYVRTDCGADNTDVSNWVGPFPFSIIAGDNCGTAIDLSAETTPFSGTTVGAVNDFNITNCSGTTSSTAPDLVFTIDVAPLETLNFAQTANAYDSKVYMAYGACPGDFAANEIFCDDDPDVFSTSWTNTTGATQTVNYIQSGFGTGSGTFTIDWSITPAPSCPAPINFAVANITTTSADLSWDELASASEWDLYYGVAPLTAPDGTETVTEENVMSNMAYPITGLTSASNYEAYVRADCGVGDSSLWVGPIAFQTACAPEVAPYLETFDAAAQPACWSQSATTGGPWVFVASSPGFPFCSAGLGENTLNGGNMMALDMSGGDTDVAIVSPEVDVTALTVPTLSFDYNACNEDDAGINTIDVEAFDGTGWVSLGVIDYLTDGWETQYFDLTGFTYGVNLVQVRLRANDNIVGSPFVSDLHVDNFSIDEEPTCTDEVTGITISNITDVTADLAWDINIWDANETYEVLYGPSLDFTTGVLGAGVTSVTLTGLGPDELTQVQVIATCGALGNESFTTLACPPVDQCMYTLTMVDTNGDGWNFGATVTLTNGNQPPVVLSVPAGTCTAPCTEVYTFMACPTADIQVTYASGSQGALGDAENYYTLDGPNGFSFTDAPASAGTETFGACPTCAPPTGVTLSNICENSYDVSWTNAVVYDTVIVETSFGFFFPEIQRDTIVGSPESASVTSTAFIPWGSGTGTPVDVSIIGICSNGDQGATLTTFTAPDCDCADQCTYIVDAMDSWGDGWSSDDGIEVYINGALSTTLQFVLGGNNGCDGGGPTPCNEIFEVNVCEGADVEFIYVEGCTTGCFPGEQSFEIIAPYSAPAAVLATGTAPADGTSYAEAACPTCPTPAGTTCFVQDFETIDVSYFSYNDGAAYTVYYNTVDDFATATAGVTGTAAAGPNLATQSGLTPSTIYFFWIQEDCGGGGLSIESVSSGCETPSACPAPSALTCSVVGSDDMLVEFTNGGTGTTYEVIFNTVQDSTAAGGATVAATGTTAGATTSALVSGLTAGTEYFFWAAEDCGAQGGSDTTAVSSCSIAAANCDWEIELWDSWGDGWNGNTADIAVNGTVVHAGATVAGGQSAIFTVSVTDLDVIDVTYNGGGGFPTENAFQIRDAEGNVVDTQPAGGGFGAGPSVDTGVGMPVGVPFTYTVTPCPPPPACPVADLNFSNVTATSADIDWLSTNADGTNTYTYAYGPAPFTPGDLTEEGRVTMVSTGIHTETLSGLTSSTDYQVCLWEDCMVDGVSDTVCVTFTTLLINDECSGALPIACGDVITGSTVGANPSTIGTFTPTNESAPDVFYTFTGQLSSNPGALAGSPGDDVTLSLCNSTYDSKVDVYTGACGALSHVGGNDDFCGLQSEYGFSTIVGEVYTVRVYGFGGGSSGTYEVAMTCEDPCLPIPADCAAPNSLTLEPFGTAPNVTGTNECAPVLTGGFGCGSTFASFQGVFYDFTTDASGEIYLAVDLGTIAAGDLGLALYEVAPCDGTLDAIACGSTFGNIVPSAFDLDPNTTYKLAVFTLVGEEGSFDIVVTGPPPPPANDDCAGAIAVPVETGVSCTGGTSMTLFGATQTTAPDTDVECGFVLDHDDVWASFVVPASGRVVIDYTPVSLGMGTVRTALYSSATDCSAMSFISGSCSLLDPKVWPARGLTSADALTPGETVYVRIWAPSDGFTGDFTLCVTDPVPANDECANAIAAPVTDFGTGGWVAGRSDFAFDDASTCGDGTETVFFSFTATDANHQINARPLSGGTYDAVIEVFDGCGGASLGCFDNYAGSTMERALVEGLVEGNTYVYSVSDAGGAVNSAFETGVRKFNDGSLDPTDCGVLDYTLDDAVYVVRDDLGDLYANANVPVIGYGIRFQEVGGGLDVAVDLADGVPYIGLVDVPGLEYGKTYDVSVRHRVRLSVNGTIDEYWSNYQMSCVIGLQPLAPVTQLTTAFCGAVDLQLADQIFADPVVGATEYRFTFVGGGQSIAETSANYTVFLYNVSSQGNSLQYNTAYSVTVEALVNGVWTQPGMVCSIGMGIPEDADVQATYCGGTYDFPAPNFILATQIYGADSYTWRFTPVGGGAAQETTTPGLSLAFHITDLALTAGQWQVDVKVTAGGVTGDYTGNPCVITINDISASAPSDGNDFAAKLNAVSSINAEVYPNPTSGENITINLTDMSDENQVIRLEVVDVTGKLVHSEQLVNKGSEANFIVDFDQKLTTGMYFVNMYVNDTMLVEKLSVK